MALKVNQRQKAHYVCDICNCEMPEDDMLSLRLMEGRWFPNAKDYHFCKEHSKPITKLIKDLRIAYKQNDS